MSNKNKGTVFVSVRLPNIYKNIMDENSGQYEAKLYRNDKAIVIPINAKDGRRWNGGDRSDLVYRDAIISNDSQIFDDDDLEINLRSSMVTFPITSRSSLFVNESTYMLIAAVVAFLSTMLGGGWIWKLLEYIRKRGNASI